MERFSPLDVATFWLGTTPQQYRNYDQNIYFLTRTKNIRYKKLTHLKNCTHRAENPTSTTSKPRQTIRKTYVNTLGMRHILVQQTCLVEEIVFISSSGIFKNNDITIYQLQCSYSSTILERRQSAIVQPYCNHTSSVVQPQLRKKYG